jgi:phage terminase large subunit-like protein
MTATLTRDSRSTRSAATPTAARAKVAALPPTLGPQVSRWMERNLVHGPGDRFGRPFRMHPYFRAFVYRAYELKPDGARRFTRAVLGVAKGNAKTEYAGAVACAELGGPVVFDHWDAQGRPVGRRRVSPEIPVAAASFDQADLLFGAARHMVKEGPLAEYFDVFDTEILEKGGPGKMERVAAVAGTNDGKRPTFFVADEVHEWTGKKERVHLVLSNGRAKRTDSWELDISTAGWDINSMLGRKYMHGKRVAIGEVEDDALLFMWYEPSGDVDLANLEQLRQAIREANPAHDSFVDVEALVQRSREIPEFEFRRYHLNQWVDSPERWLPFGAWDSCAAADRVVPDGAEIVLVLDGTYNGESTALMGATIEEKPHLFKLDAWEKGERDDWKVTIAEAEDAVRRACERFVVRQIGADPNRWRTTIARFEEEGLPVVAYESHLASRMVPACAQFYDGVVGKLVTHDGDERVGNHIANAVIKIDGRGPRIAKEHKDSDRHIDLAVAAVGAYDLAVRQQSEGDNDWRPIE